MMEILFLLLLLATTGLAQEGPFGVKNFPVGIAIGTVCTAVVCCIPHLICCCVCVFVTRRKWKAWQARKQTKGAVTTIPSQGFSVPANVENTTSVVYTPDPISQNTPAIQPSTTSSSNHTPTPHRVAPPPPVHTNLATSTNSPGAQVTMSASDHITRVQQQQQPTSRQHNLSPTPHRHIGELEATGGIHQSNNNRYNNLPTPPPPPSYERTIALSPNPAYGSNSAAGPQNVSPNHMQTAAAHHVTTNIPSNQVLNRSSVLYESIDDDYVL